jgi:hypothetical protein
MHSIPPKPYLGRNASTEQVLEACQRAADSPAFGALPGWAKGAIRDGKGGLKGRQSALWVLYLRELAHARQEASERWGIQYLVREHQETLATPLGDRPSFAERKALEDALWALYRLERDAEATLATSSPQRTCPKGKRGGSRNLKVV